MNPTNLATENTGRIRVTMDRERKKSLEKFGRFYTLPIEMAVAVFVPAFVGRWLDGKTGKDPWFTVIGMVLGGAAAIRSAHRALREWQQEPKDEVNSTAETPKNVEPPSGGPAI